MEIWKPIKINSNYLVSNTGKIKSLNYRNSKKEKELVCYGIQYNTIKISVEDKMKDVYVHKLVAQAFIPNPNNYPCINHINGDKRDNRVENLEWCTYQHNTKEAFKLGLSKNRTGRGNGRSKAVQQLDSNGKIVAEWESMRLAEIKLKIRHIADCCTGKRKTAGGFIWKYKCAREDLKNNLVEE